MGEYGRGNRLEPLRRAGWHCLSFLLSTASSLSNDWLMERLLGQGSDVPSLVLRSSLDCVSETLRKRSTISETQLTTSPSIPRNFFLFFTLGIEFFQRLNVVSI